MVGGGGSRYYRMRMGTMMCVSRTDGEETGVWVGPALIANALFSGKGCCGESVVAGKKFFEESEIICDG